ncbi:prephenate dehydratase [Corynebacterium sp. 320]|uniref:prephenate dehydratase n=1 Tax=Corynebacterium TaxID=1716 RepID=UPI00125CAFDE|nr:MULTISPECIES: prephenate dehydratase [Corynebacterium]KAB1504349.1 prephenate dehydratase [Corynebacterium sp. 320]KAB1552551.1 prephenate dehydratase [Corynebacterium sp. 321]KAB3528485.1 prephenate dehydratase [Corynebacterium sp. 250]QNP92025.1 prephenate dehydratase [Corynebacterium zhongnanshanii]
MTTPSCRLAYLGPRGTFTEQALHDFVAEGKIPGLTSAPDTAAIEQLPVESPTAALNAVRRGDADFAVVALESAVDGSVTQTEDALMTGSPVHIFNEVVVPVEFAIMTRPGTTLDQVRTISCHPVAHAQIRDWLATHLPHARFVPAASNGAAAESVATGEIDAAAAPARAADLHGLSIHHTGVADVPGAFTRFVLVGRPGTPTPRSGQDRTSIILTLKNRPASLQEALMELSMRGVDLSRIESRPLRNPGGSIMGIYVFHIDMVGHIEDDAVAEALAALHRNSEDMRYLGSWPIANVGVSMHAGSAPADFGDSWKQVRAWARGDE